MDSLDRRVLLGGLGLVGATAVARAARGGPLDPPSGPVSPTGRTLQEVYEKVARTDLGFAEPRVPVQSLPGGATAVHVISAPGSYYLTANVVGTAGRNGIEVVSEGVALDLGGFSIIGSGGTSLSGIRTGDFIHRIRIGNGSVLNWGLRGVAIGNGAEGTVLENLVARGNGQGGIAAATTTTIVRCRCERNGGSGINGGSLVLECECYDNANAGIDANAALISRCRVGGNFLGVFCGEQVMVTECVARGNGTGITAFGRARVVGNHVSLNNTGISVGDGTVTEDNTIVGNAGVGLAATGTGALVLRNSAQGNSPNFAIAPGNAHGPIVSVAGLGDLAVVPGANHPGANFSY